jgi:excisionase family DNA binding protein
MQEVFINIPITAESELLTPEQLAARLQVPLSWVYEQSRHDKIPTHRVGRYIRFHIREVLQHLEDAARVDSSIRKAG